MLQFTRGTSGDGLYAYLTTSSAAQNVGIAVYEDNRQRNVDVLTQFMRQGSKIPFVSNAVDIEAIVKVGADDQPSPTINGGSPSNLLRTL